MSARHAVTEPVTVQRRAGDPGVPDRTPSLPRQCRVTARQACGRAPCSSSLGVADSESDP
eukprot:347550-Hanusia_phi.AAC.1